jgi:hypothetical protein
MLSIPSAIVRLRMAAPQNAPDPDDSIPPYAHRPSIVLTVDGMLTCYHMRFPVNLDTTSKTSYTYYHIQCVSYREAGI